MGRRQHYLLFPLPYWLVSLVVTINRSIFYMWHRRFTLCMGAAAPKLSRSVYNVRLCVRDASASCSTSVERLYRTSTASMESIHGLGIAIALQCSVLLFLE